MKRIVPMLLTVIMVSVFLSSCKKSNPISSYIPSSSFKPSSSAESTENSKTPIHEMLDKDDILGGIGRIYTIDKRNYNQVLEEGEINGKDINSDQEQR